MYDGDGGRVKKLISSSAHELIGETTYIGSLYETEIRGQTTEVRKYIYAGSNRICSLHITHNTLHSYYYHGDHLGSSNVVTDASGVQAALTEFTPYGSTFKQTGTFDPKHKFTGKELDTSTNLYYYGARYYDHELGRFVTADSIIQAPYDPQSLNRYSYCRNNPINYIDPTGHKWSWKKFWHAAVGVFVGAVAAIVSGPAGLAWYGATMSGMIGGALGGSITGGLDGGWQGALIGGATGGILGGVGGWGVDKFGLGFAAGMLAAGAGVAGATNSWDSFAGGLAGGLAGWGTGSGITGAYKQQFANYRAGNGFRSNADVIMAKIKSGEIDWRTIVSYINDSNTPVEVKSEMVDMLEAYSNRNFNFKEQKPGHWLQKWGQDTTIETSVGGVAFEIPGNTTMSIKYLGGYEYGICANNFIMMGYLGIPADVGMNGSFSTMRVYYNNFELKVLRTDMTKSIMRNILEGGYDLRRK